MYRWHKGAVEAVYEMDAEFGAPQWGFGMSTYGFESADSIICAYTHNGFWYLARLDTKARRLIGLDVPFSDIRSVRVARGKAVFIGASPTMPSSVVVLDLASSDLEVLRRSSDVAIDPSYISLPEPVEYPTERRRTAFAFYYPPRNGDYVAPAGEKPPLLVMTHGGPTAATSAGFSLTIQYWTSHGFAVLDVNYGGSTGYGREYRQRLNGQWGIVDVDDVVNGALYLVRRGDVDGGRLAIDGGSAGGYTTLCALAFRNVFQAGASYFGVSDLEALAKDTHKFESRYLDSIVAPYPEQRELYVQRSPIHAVDRIECPMILFQGLEDKVVPPNQAERIYEAVRAKGLPVAYMPFKGEQHGFRHAENIKRSLDGEFYFYSRVFGFQPAEEIEPVNVENIGAI
jgi:dipeptidyl aminopeptidase/acylaminoacyl peptidase